MVRTERRTVDWDVLILILGEGQRPAATGSMVGYLLAEVPGATHLPFLQTFPGSKWHGVRSP